MKRRPLKIIKSVEKKGTDSKSTGEEPLLSNSGSPLFSAEKEALFRKHYEEQCDIGDPEYMAWVKLMHPEANGSVQICQTFLLSLRPCIARPKRKKNNLD